MNEGLQIFRFSGVAVVFLVLIACLIGNSCQNPGLRRKLYAGGIAVGAFFGTAYAVKTGAFWYGVPWPGAGMWILRLVFFPFVFFETVRLPILTGVFAAFLYGLPVWVIYPKFALADYKSREHTQEFEQENSGSPD